jgi:hypothetical protein
MLEKILLSSAYFPPVQYLSLIHHSAIALIEKEENYLKQSYRNRCSILTSNGPSALIVPVFSAGPEKIPVKEVRIDYSKRWQQVHLRALISSYRSSAFFEYYFEDFEKLISSNPECLFELNENALRTILKITGISSEIRYTDSFEHEEGKDYDFRYLISPKKKIPGNTVFKEYFQVFSNKFGFVPGLSILDLIFNAGPDTINYL